MNSDRSTREREIWEKGSKGSSPSPAPSPLKRAKNSLFAQWALTNSECYKHLWDSSMLTPVYPHWWPLHLFGVKLMRFCSCKHLFVTDSLGKQSQERRDFTTE